MSNQMTAHDFADWADRMMMTRGWSRAECARRLGCGVNQVAVWRRTGAPRYIALACMALASGLPPWRRPADLAEVSAAE